MTKYSGKRIGVFGGTFDPIHVGHLIIAEAFRDQSKLDHVLFIPAGVPPHKRAQEITPGSRRKEMVELAIAGNLEFAVEPIELDRSGPSYTVETLQILKERYDCQALYLLIGSDGLRDFPTWYQPEQIAASCTLVVGKRPGFPIELPECNLEITWEEIEFPQLEISSSWIRDQVARQRSIRYCVPNAVECYIAQHELYGYQPASAESKD